MPGRLGLTPARSRRFTLLAVLVLAGVFAGGFMARFLLRANEPAWRLVQQGLRQTYLAPAGYVQVIERQVGPRMEREVFQVWQDGPRRRVIQLEPRTRAGFTTDRRALATYTYAPELREILKTFTPEPPLPAPPHQRFWRVRQASLEASVVYQGQQTEVVALLSHGRVRQRLWITAGAPFVIRQERYDRRGQLMDVTVNRSVIRSREVIAKALARARPEGPVVSDRAEWYRRYFVACLTKEAPFRFLAPKATPPGLRLAAAGVAQVGSERVVALRFAGGKHPVSLFEQPKGAAEVNPLPPPPPPGQGIPRGITVIRRTMQGFDLVLIGPVKKSEAEALFASLMPVQPAGGRPTAR